MADWIPISPTLDQTGAFAALANLPNGAALKPVPLAAEAVVYSEQDTTTPVGGLILSAAKEAE